MPWTPAQQDAISSRGCNLLVSAAAGSGKTAVLTERIVSLIQEGVQVDDLLVVTFTRAAAAEMRTRILTALHDAADKGDKRMAAQAMRVERADISTLHGFCKKICQNHFQAAGIDPTFRIADTAEVNILKKQALQEAMIQCYEQPSAAFQAFSDAFSQDEIIAMMESLYPFLMSRPDPWEWFASAIQAHHITPEQMKHSPWVQALLTRTSILAQTAVQSYQLLVQLSNEIDQYQALARSEAEKAFALLEAAEQGVEAVIAFPKVTYDRLTTKKGFDKELAAEFKAARDKAKSLLNAAWDSTALFGSLETSAADESDNAEKLQGLYDLAFAYHELLMRQKAERNILDFNDLEHFTLKALRMPEVAQATAARYRYIFIDEYQDSSLLQEALIDQIKQDDNLFMVGDVKQSIYRFRLADPSIFTRKETLYASTDQEKARSIFLNANFRSVSTVLNGTNDVFSSILNGGPMELTYTTDHFLYQGIDANEDGAPVELHLFSSDSSEDQGDVDADTDIDLDDKLSIRQEANFIADKILSLNAEGVPFRDMAILLRTVRSTVPQVMDIMRLKGIPAWSDIGENSLERTEVHCIVSLLQIIDNLYQDIPLVSALRGPLLSLSDDNLATIRIAKPEGTFADAMMAYAQGDSELALVLRGFVEQVRGWSLDAQVIPLDVLIRQIYDQSGFYSAYGALPEGDLRQSTLRLLADHAGQYQRMFGGGVGSFLRYLEGIKTSENGLTARDVGDGDNIVRIMSIHKSKGLQFPVVFIAGLGRRLNRNNHSSPCVFHSELGIGLDFRNAKLRARSKPISYYAIEAKDRMESLAEEARILYVAMTRAEKRLFMVGTLQKGDEAKLELPTIAPAAVSSMLEWISPAASSSTNWVIEWHHPSPIHATAKSKADLQVIHTVIDLKDHSEAVMLPQFDVLSSDEAPVIPLKQSVSSVVKSLRKEAEDDDPFLYVSDLLQRPLFMEEKGMTAAERGTAVHTFLSSVALDAESAKQEIERMQDEGILSHEQAVSLPVIRLQAFMNSNLWIRIRYAQQVRREWPFNLRMQTGDQRTLLQGVIDCCFLEQGSWVLVDYKTDRSDNIEEIVQLYRPQLEIYADALAALTTIPVKERILYLLMPEKELLL